MPYRLSNDGNAVEKVEGHKVTILHRYTGSDAHKKALKYLAALEMNVLDAHKTKVKSIYKPKRRKNSGK
jgi:hypothetical protein